MRYLLDLLDFVEHYCSRNTVCTRLIMDLNRMGKTDAEIEISTGAKGCMLKIASVIEDLYRE